MMKHSILFILIFLAYQFTAAQYLNVKVETGDFNQDGMTDSLIIGSSPGSGFYYYDYILIDGTGKLRDTINIAGCKCSMTNLTPIPDVLMKPENRLFREALESHWNEPEKYIDHSQNWVFDGYLNSFPLDSNSVFAHIIQTQEGWYAGTPQPPYNQSVIISGDTLARMVNAFFPHDFQEVERAEWANVKQAWFIYWGNSHRPWSHPKSTEKPSPFKLADTSETYQLFNTTHGVYIQKGDQYRWLFISQIGLTSAPVRLSSASIQTAKIVGDLVVINHISPHLGKPRIYMIDIQSGRVGDLQLDQFFISPEAAELGFIVDKDVLKIRMTNFDPESETRSTTFTSFSLEKIKESLNQ